MFQDADGAVCHMVVRKSDRAFCIGRLREDCPCRRLTEYCPRLGLPCPLNAPAPWYRLQFRAGRPLRRTTAYRLLPKSFRNLATSFSGQLLVGSSLPERSAAPCGS